MYREREREILTISNTHTYAYCRETADNKPK